ncbi:MAG: stage II sporulation protein D [Erysipelotrichia bacterium]|nr:stage II sporulation protein D [Erysipelotrichia bacterium]NCC55537.1 stage II sporulation protein D [Erysipelotrichia bacterium]
MRNLLIKIIMLVVLWLVSVLIFVNRQPPSEQKQQKVVSETMKAKKEEAIVVRIMRENKVEEVALETYLEGVLASEMPYTFALEALKAQCVAARTFVLQRNLCVDDTTSSQVYKSESELIEIYQEEYETMMQKVRQAIQETKGLVLRYDGHYISAMFYSSNNGKSNDASWYYQNEQPYLKSVDSHWDLDYPQTTQTTTIEYEQMMRLLNVRDLSIQNVTYYENGYVKTINIGGCEFSGREIREKLQLRSSCFQMQNSDAGMLVTTVGFGHGVGLSQYGAQGMALEGYDFKAILTHYYQGVSIEKI